MSLRCCGSSPRSSTPAGKWQRRFVERAAELGDQEALGVATTQLFAEAITARDRAEMDRLHPVLISLITPETSPRVLGWVYYSLFGRVVLDGRFEEAYEHACSSVERAREIGHGYMLVCALEARLLARWAVDGEITQPELAEVFELAQRPRRAFGGGCRRSGSSPATPPRSTRRAPAAG